MGGSNVENLRLDEPVSLRKLRVFYMEGIQENAFVQPLDWQMRSALRKVCSLPIFQNNNQTGCTVLREQVRHRLPPSGPAPSTPLH